MKETRRARGTPDLRGTEGGVFGIEAVLQDFDASDLDTIRNVADVIRTRPQEGVYSAIALAGSAAASRVQAFPGDCDYFERVNIAAPTREEAIAILPSLMIETVGYVFKHPDLQFTEMKLGLHAFDSRRGEQAFRTGEPISWGLADIDSRSMTVEDAEGRARLIEMAEVAGNPGFVKLDWIMADRERDRIVAVTKVIDPTWEAPDGSIVALDGVLDGFYQEVYLDADSREHVERIIERGEPSGLPDYIGQLELEIRKFIAPGHENYGKIAKRLYNVFRITNRPGQAAYVRSLFDDPAARLYQVEGVMRALGQTLGAARMDRTVIREQIGIATRAIEDCYTRPDRDEIVKKVASLTELQGSELQAVIDDVSARVSDEVSDYFRDRLEAEGGVAEYLAMIRYEVERA